MCNKSLCVKPDCKGKTLLKKAQLDKGELHRVVYFIFFFLPLDWVRKKKSKKWNFELHNQLLAINRMDLLCCRVCLKRNDLLPLNTLYLEENGSGTRSIYELLENLSQIEVNFCFSLFLMFLKLSQIFRSTKLTNHYPKKFVLLANMLFSPPTN